jgi:hypothetical protein
MSTSIDELEEELEEEQDEEQLEIEYLTALQESMMIRALTGSSSQKLTTINRKLLFILR